MNSTQNAAVGGFLLLITAFFIMREFGDNVFVVILAGFFVVALLTFATTWKIVYAILGMLGDLVSGIGHGIGSLGDWFAKWMTERRQRLSHRLEASAPDWSDPALKKPVTNADDQEEHRLPQDGSPTDDLDVPEFMKDENDKQQDVGLRIFEPR